MNGMHLYLRIWLWAYKINYLERGMHDSLCFNEKSLVVEPNFACMLHYYIRTFQQCIIVPGLTDRSEQNCYVPLEMLQEQEIPCGNACNEPACGYKLKKSSYIKQTTWLADYSQFHKFCTPYFSALVRLLTNFSKRISNTGRVWATTTLVSWIAISLIIICTLYIILYIFDAVI